MARDCTELKESMVSSLKFKCKAIEGQLDYMYVCVKGQKERPLACKKNFKPENEFSTQKNLQVIYTKTLLK